MFRTVTKSGEETQSCGYKLGSLLKPGDVVVLEGGLGAGKTVFTGGIAKALGIKGYITSPTFTIVNEYSGSLPLYHFDAYRIDDPDEMFEIGFEEYLEAGGVVVVEWAERIKELIPDNNIYVKIEKLPGGNIDESSAGCAESYNRRIITIEFPDGRKMEPEDERNNEDGRQK
jgi:tRNA threonylcarbamoyladenosine biosynthesis protein TsaE